MSKVYYLLHRHIIEEDFEECKGLGMYSSLNKLKEAAIRYRSKVGFDRYPNCFFYQIYELDSELWTEGFDENEKPIEEYIPLQI